MCPVLRLPSSRSADVGLDRASQRPETTDSLGCRLSRFEVAMIWLSHLTFAATQEPGEPLFHAPFPGNPCLVQRQAKGGTPLR
jgi:hypothetical protein